jgi:altronate dehydratase
MLGYASHPLVRHCLLLEHGCEKTHNAYWRQQMARAGIDPQPFGWASIQLDGGIQAVMRKMSTWFADRALEADVPVRVQANASAIRLGLMTNGRVSEMAAATLARLVQWLVTAGGTVVLPTQDSLLYQIAFLRPLGLPSAPSPSLAFAQRPTQAGCHIMQTPSAHWTETLTGLGATGVEVVLALLGSQVEAASGSPLPGHPLIPLLRVAEEPIGQLADLDAGLVGDEALWAGQLLELVQLTLSQTIIPITNRLGNTDFQITRGVSGVSL